MRWNTPNFQKRTCCFSILSKLVFKLFAEYNGLARISDAKNPRWLKWSYFAPNCPLCLSDWIKEPYLLLLHTSFFVTWLSYPRFCAQIHFNKTFFIVYGCVMTLLSTFKISLVVLLWFLKPNSLFDPEIHRKHPLRTWTKTVKSRDLASTGSAGSADPTDFSKF